MVHNIAIDIESSDKPIGIDKVFDFDDKAYDTGIYDKILIAVPGLSKEAVRFARRQVPFLERATMLLEKIPLRRVELLCYTEEEFRERVKEIGIVAEAVKGERLV